MKLGLPLLRNAFQLYPERTLTLPLGQCPGKYCPCHGPNLTLNPKPILLTLKNLCADPAHLLTASECTAPNMLAIWTQGN